MEESRTPVTNVIVRQNGRSVKGVHYSCDKCDHTSTHNSNLKRHVQSQQETVNFYNNKKNIKKIRKYIYIYFYIFYI